jgi:hypothetical protein
MLGKKPLNESGLSSLKAPGHDDARKRFGQIQQTRLNCSFK